MADPLIAKWKTAGAVFVWRYREKRRNYPGWHMTADDHACDSLVDLFDRFRRARFPSKVIISVARPTARVLAVPANPAKVDTPTELAIRYDKQADPSAWNLVQEGGQPRLSCGSGSLSELERCVKWVKAGGGHCCETTGRDDQELSFWWLLK
jgi:hypothetical protein